MEKFRVEGQRLWIDNKEVRLPRLSGIRRTTRPAMPAPIDAYCQGRTAGSILLLGGLVGKMIYVREFSQEGQLLFDETACSRPYSWQYISAVAINDGVLGILVQNYQKPGFSRVCLLRQEENETPWSSFAIFDVDGRFNWTKELKVENGQFIIGGLDDDGDPIAYQRLTCQL